jgi:hypothetical protein
MYKILKEKMYKILNKIKNLKNQTNICFGSTPQIVTVQKYAQNDFRIIEM